MLKLGRITVGFPIIVCPLADQYEVFVDWEFFSMSMDLIRCAGRGHLTVDVLWKKFEIWMGQLKVKVIHASVTQKCWAECNKTMRRFGLDCVKLSGLSAWVAWQLNTIQTKSTHDLAHLAQHFVSDGACFTLTFNCPIQISKFFHKTSTVRCPLPAHLIKSVDIEKKFSVDKNVIWAFEGTDYLGLVLCIYENWANM